MVNSVSSGDLNPNAYGSIKKAGVQNNGRVLYSVFDSNGNENKKLSVPLNQADTFEKSYNTILDKAPKIKEYVKVHSSKEDIRKRKYLSAFVLANGGFWGCMLPLWFTRNKSSLTQILSTGTGIFIGLTAGLAYSLNIMTPPGTYEFQKATKELKKLDIQIIKNK